MKHSTKSPSAPEQNTPRACLPQQSWLALAAGLLPEAETMSYLSHAGACPNCSALLHSTISMLDDEVTSEEQAFLDRLRSSSQADQRRLAAELSAKASTKVQPSPVVLLHRQFPGRLLWTGLAAMLALVAVLWAYRAFRPASDTTLLAKAYEKNRLSELRFPGAKAVALASPTRGAANTEVYSSELLLVKLRSQQRFETAPNNPLVRQTMGRIALVEHDGESARRQFEMAEALDEHLPDLEFDLASAYFEIAESTGDPLNYARAADLYSRHIHALKKTDPVAFFNRGICWERQSIFREATKDFERALSVEKDTAWRSEIERHLQRVKQLSQPAGASNGVSEDMTPAGFLRVVQTNPQLADTHYERYLDAAMTGWMTQRGTSREAYEALEKLVGIGLLHQDAWLRDWLHTPPNALDLEADRQLSAGVVADDRGDAAAALPAVERAAVLYRRGGDQPGALRAEIEKVYSLQLLLRGNDCLEQAMPLRDRPALKSYSWSRTYLLLEISACKASTGDIPEGIKHADAALKLAIDSRLPAQELRARFFVADDYRLGGDAADAWKMETVGLARSADENNPTRSYAFLQGLLQASRTLAMPWTATALADAAVDEARRAHNVRDSGYALELLGTKESEIGYFNEADRSFDAADRLLAETVDKRSVAYRAHLESDRALSLARRGQLQDAMLRMKQVPALTSDAASVDSRLNYYTEESDLLRQLGRTSEARDNALLAVAAAEQTLAPLKTELQRRYWETRTSKSYEVLVQSLLDAGQPEEALKLWEWHRVAGYRPAFTTISDSAGPRLPSVSEIPRVPAGQIVLVYAKILDHYVAWSVQDSPKRQVRAIRITADPGRIATLAFSFSRLCADRRSSIADISLLGDELYRQLLAPFAAELHSATTIRLELDDTLRTAPFAALPVPTGGYLTEHHATLLLAVMWSLRGASEGFVNSEMHLVAINGGTSDSPLLPADYDEAPEIAKRFQNAVVLKQQNSDEKHLLALLPTADVFHYSGHASSDSENSGLMLGGGPERFTADSISGLHLQHCRLAVLAACETDGAVTNRMEDSANLPHALLNAGVNYVVAAQWAIDSQTTRLLMLRFYENLSHRQSVATALQTAQQVLLTSSARHPYYWSAFRVFGE